jgi:peptidoglycan/LPS O-acetylase OafA/YrhL
MIQARSGAVSLASAATSRNNNFDAIRLVAAMGVLVSHAFALTGHVEPFEPNDTVGTVCVEVFFAISGFLVVRSWLGDPSFRRYLVKRLLRLLPALAVASLVTAFVVGPIFTTFSVQSYLRNFGAYEYVLRNSLLRTFDFLPGVFPGNVYHEPNGSLWTLPVEAFAYVCVLLAGILGVLRHRSVLLAAWVATVVLVAVSSDNVRVRLLAVFLTGVTMYVFRATIVLRPAVAALLGLVILCAFWTPFAAVSAVLFLPYLVLCVAYLRVWRGIRLTRFGDVSYGLYLYAWPIEQVVIDLTGSRSPVLVIAIAAPLSWLAGLASWRLVERRAMKIKTRRREQAQALPLLGAG